MKQAMICLVCLASLLMAATTQAQDSTKSDPRFRVGVGIGARTMTGDTPAPRVGETTNLLQVGVHAQYQVNPVISLVADWAYGWRTLDYKATSTLGGGGTIESKSEATGWSLNGLFALSLPVGDRGGQFYAGPGFNLTNGELVYSGTRNGESFTQIHKLGTNLGLVVGAGAIIPINEKWHGFFAFRHSWVEGQYIVNTENSSVDSQVPLGGSSAMVGAGIGF